MPSESGVKIWLTHRVAERIQSDAAKYFPLETGGVLLGWRNGMDRIIVDAIGAGPKALHGRLRFLPDHAFQVRHIDNAFRTSDGDLDYLGDWHTHPDGIARMSSEDTSTLRRISRKVKTPVMLIAAGSNSSDWKLRCWLQPEGGFLSRVEPVDTEIRLFDPPPSWPSYSELSGEVGSKKQDPYPDFKSHNQKAFRRWNEIFLAS